MKKVNNTIIFVSAVSLPLTLLAASNVNTIKVSANTITVKSANKQNVNKSRSLTLRSKASSSTGEMAYGVGSDLMQEQTSANLAKKNSSQNSEVTNFNTAEKDSINKSTKMSNETPGNTLVNNEGESKQLERAASFAQVTVSATPTSTAENPLGWNNVGYMLSFSVTNQSNTDEVIPRGSKLTIKIEPDNRVSLDEFLVYSSITQSSDIFSIANNHNGSYDITINKDLVPGTYNCIVNFATRSTNYDWNKPVGSNTINPDPVPGKVTVTSNILGSSNEIYTGSVFIKPGGYVVPGPGVGAPGYATAGFNGLAEFNTDSEYRNETSPVYLPDGTTLRNPNDKSASGSMFFSYIVNYQAAIGSQAGAKLSVKSKDKIDLQHYHLLIDKRITGGQIEDITNNPLLKWNVADNEVTVDAGKYMTTNNLGYPLFLRVYVPEQSAEAINEVTLQTGPSFFSNKSTFQYIGTDSSTPYFRGGNVTIYDTETFDAKTGLMAFEGTTSLTNKIIVTDYDGYPVNGQNPRAGSYNIKYEVTGSNNTKTSFTRTIIVKHNENPVIPKDPDLVSNVIVHYQDENGNRIASNEVLTGKVGDGYQTLQKSVAGYTFKEVRGNAIGFFTPIEQIVTYIYIQNNNDQKRPNNIIDPDSNHQTNKVKKPYSREKNNQLSANDAKNNRKVDIKPKQLPLTGKEQNSANSLLLGIYTIAMAISGFFGFRKKRNH